MSFSFGLLAGFTPKSPLRTQPQHIPTYIHTPKRWGLGLSLSDIFPQNWRTLRNSFSSVGPAQRAHWEMELSLPWQLLLLLLLPACIGVGERHYFVMDFYCIPQKHHTDNLNHKNMCSNSVAFRWCLCKICNFVSGATFGTFLSSVQKTVTLYHWFNCN